MNSKLANHKVRFYRGTGSPLIALKVRPNDPCPCGSSKKAKKCCGTETKLYNSKQMTK